MIQKREREQCYTHSSLNKKITEKFSTCDEYLKSLNCCCK
jgi:hypothetical protein